MLGSETWGSFDESEDYGDYKRVILGKPEDKKTVLEDVKELIEIAKRIDEKIKKIFT
jgi:hypothetical protein